MITVEEIYNDLMADAEWRDMCIKLLKLPPEARHRVTSATLASIAENEKQALSVSENARLLGGL